MSGSGSRSNSASTRAIAAPCRTSPVSARAPSASPRASMSRLLPAPVSPVITFSPGPSSSRTRSISARSVDRQLEQAPRRVVAHDGSSSTLRRRRSQNGTAPSGSTNRIERGPADTSTTSPTATGQVLAAVDADERLVRVDDPAR